MKDSNSRESNRKLLLGNEAIAVGALEAGITYAGAYPGTPSTEITQYLIQNKQQTGVQVEWCMNEKIAFEKALGVSLCGQRAIVSMKHAGVNWIADTLSVAVLGGIRGGLVIVSADDPNCHSSANEQDNRFYAQFFKIPVVEPGNPQDARDLVIKAFELSEEIELPVIFRTVTRVSHTRSDVSYGHFFGKAIKKSVFDPCEDRFYLSTARSLAAHKRLVEKQQMVQDAVYRRKLNVLEEADSPVLVIAAGIGYEYTREALGILAAEAAILKVVCGNYLSESIVDSLLKRFKTFLVVEEGRPFVETTLNVLNSRLNGAATILGKLTGHLKSYGELTIQDIAEFLENTGLGSDSRTVIPAPGSKHRAPQRPASFCAGCPHSNVFHVLNTTRRKIKKKTGQRLVVIGDIGCYSIGKNPPYDVGDVKFSMGSSVGVAQGIADASEDKVVALIGDGTFFHAGITSVANCIRNNSNMAILVLDNGVIAMTGMQPTPASQTPEGGSFSIEAILSGFGYDDYSIVDSFNIEELRNSLRDALAKSGLSVIIARGPCAVMRKKNETAATDKSYGVDQDKCRQCFLCITSYSCPALSLSGDKTVEIDQQLCIGCSSCAQICPDAAIVEIMT